MVGLESSSPPTSMNTLGRFLSAATLILLLLSFQSCKKPMSPASPSSLDELNIEKQEIKSYLLPNGLTILVQEDHSSPVVSVQAWCKAGSITEGRFVGAGISHILEHMLFKGTKKRGNSAIAQTIQSVGGYVNAYTTFDRTVYYVDAPSSGWKTALDVLADAIFHSTLPVEEFAKEQEVIRREFAMGFDNPQNVLFKNLFATAFQVHPYKYPVIGHLEVYNKLTRQDVLDYYHHHYVPNNLTFIITGAVQATEVRDFLEQFTASIERQGLPDTYIPAEPKQLGRRENHQTFPTQVSRLTLAWPIPGITNPDIYALDVLSIIAGDGSSSRLNQELVEKRKLLNSASAFSYTPAQSGLWGVSAFLPPDSPVTLAEAEKAILALLEEFKTKPVSTTELAKARRKVIVGRAAELKTVAGKAASIGSSWFTTGDTAFDETYLNGISKVNAADLQRVANTYLTPQTLNVVSLSPQTETANSAPALPSTSQRATPAQETLPSGLPLVYLADPKVPLVTVRAIVMGGSLAEKPETNGISNLMVRLLSKGTSNRSAEQIATEIENLGGNLETGSGNNSFTIAIEVLQPDLTKAIELLSDILLNPNFPQEELEQEKRQQLSEIKLQEDKPTALAQKALKKALFQNHPYGLDSLGTAQSLEKITREQISQFHRGLLGKERIVLTVGGSFDLDKARQEFTTYFPASALTPSPAALPLQDPNFPPESKLLKLMSDKKQAIVMIGYPGIDIKSPDRAALELIDEALSDLASRLFIRIREQQSLAYFVGTQQMIGLQRGMFVFYAGTAPGKDEKVRTEIMDEVQKIAAQGLTQEEIERARTKLLGKRLLQDQNASVTVYKAGLNLLYSLGLDFENQLNEKIRTLSLNEVQTTAKKFFSTQNEVAVLLQPNSDTAAQPQPGKTNKPIP
jgi:zinc protease